MPPDDSQTAKALWALKTDLDTRHDENTERHNTTDERLEEVLRQIKKLSDGFPAGDTDGHRRYHEAVIKRAEARAKLWEETRAHVIKNGFWLGLGFLCWTLWQAFKAKVAG